MGKQDQLQDFRNYDFDASKDFQQWLSTVEVVNPDNAAMQKLRARWYRKNIDVNFDPSWLADAPPASAQGSNTPGRAGNFNTSSASSRPANAGSQPAASSAPPQGGSSWGSSGASSRNQQNQIYLLALNVAVVFLSLLHLIPLIPSFSLRAYRLLMQILVIGNGYKLVQQYGWPPVRPFSWPRLQQYLASIMPTTTFHLMLIGVMFGSQQPIAILLPFVAIPALYDVLEFMHAHAQQSKIWQLAGSRLYAYLQPKKRDSQLVGAYSEIATGGMLVLLLFTAKRNLMLTFLYWNMLKMRYHVGDAAAYHRVVWHAVGQRTERLRTSVPLINTAVGYATQWFLSVQGR